MAGIDDVLRDALGMGRDQPQPQQEGSVFQGSASGGAPLPFLDTDAPETNMVVRSLTSGRHDSFNRALRKRGLQ